MKRGGRKTLPFCLIEDISDSSHLLFRHFPIGPEGYDVIAVVEHIAFDFVIPDEGKCLIGVPVGRVPASELVMIILQDLFPAEVQEEVRFDMDGQPSAAAHACALLLHQDLRR